ncbi:hypothetical protein BDW22DRAFT_476974 [Trametopsis cervina]|nr:hypothetical protein BDW22DRAFT_476974 [Trametopsis cervina]
MMYTRVVLFAALFSTVVAYSDTNPVIVWSSHSTTALSSTPESPHPEYLLDSLLGTDNVCENDAIILVDHAGLHASDLRFLSRSSALVQNLGAAPSSLEFPYVRRSLGNPFTGIARAIADRCGAKTLTVASGEVGPHIGHDSDKKHVVCLGMPPIEGPPASRQQMMAQYELLLSSDLEAMSTAFPKHLVVYAGWHSPIMARQADEETVVPSLSDVVAPQQTKMKAKTAAREGGILKRYQLLTPGLIVTLFVTFFVLVPVVFIGISSLSSIQSSVRLDAPKGYSAAEKKNQ